MPNQNPKRTSSPLGGRTSADLKLTHQYRVRGSVLGSLFSGLNLASGSITQCTSSTSPARAGACTRLNAPRRSAFFRTSFVHHADDNIGLLVVPISTRYADFAVSEAGVKYLVNAQDAAKISCGYLVLVRQRLSEHVHIAPITSFFATVQFIPPREPRDARFGAYWWIRSDGTPDGVPSNGGAPTITDEDLPF